MNRFKRALAGAGIAVTLAIPAVFITSSVSAAAPATVSASVVGEVHSHPATRAHYNLVQGFLPLTHGNGICDGHWLSATWGRGCVQPPYGQTDDIKEDGYCVEAKYYDPSTRNWYHITNSTSCGPIASWQTNDKLCIRMYNGDGHYLTLRRQATYCP